MNRRRRFIEFICGLCHALLVLSLTLLLFRGVYYGVELLIEDARPVEAKQVGVEEWKLRKPLPQEIAESLNTHWLSFDPYHCRNVCHVSRIVCQWRNCQGVEGVKVWD